MIIQDSSFPPITDVGKTIAPLIDYTLLKPDTRQAQVVTLCHEARHYGFAAVCVTPFHLRLAVQTLAGSPIKVATVIGFPLGSTTSDSKAFETEDAVKAGAHFVKTSTGFSGGATESDIRLLRRIVGNRMGVKASGGIRSFQDALTMIRAGASRIGTSSGVAIVTEL